MTTDQPNLQDILELYGDDPKWQSTPDARDEQAKHYLNNKEAIDAIYAALLAELDLQDEPTPEIAKTEENIPVFKRVAVQNNLRSKQRQALKRWCYGENASNE